MNCYARFKYVSHRKINTTLYEILRFVKLITIIQWFPEAGEMGNSELCNGYRAQICMMKKFRLVNIPNPTDLYSKIVNGTI